MAYENIRNNPHIWVIESSLLYLIYPKQPVAWNGCHFSHETDIDWCCKLVFVTSILQVLTAWGPCQLDSPSPKLPWDIETYMFEGLVHIWGRTKPSISMLNNKGPNVSHVFSLTGNPPPSVAQVTLLQEVSKLHRLHPWRSESPKFCSLIRKVEGWCLGVPLGCIRNRFISCSPGFWPFKICCILDKFGIISTYN